jgi:hypothetical protein
MDYYPQDSSIFPQQYRSFFVAVSGQYYQEEKKIRAPGILQMEYDFTENKMVHVPKYFLEYRGSDSQVVAGLAFGPDALYFTPLLPNREGATPILKIAYNPTESHPYTLEQRSNESPLALMTQKGCFGCHSLTGAVALGGTAGPPLDRDPLVARLQDQLNSSEYLEALKEVDSLDREPFVSFKAARQEVAEAEGMDRLRIWMKYHIMEPTFDNPNSQMPNLGLTAQEASLITDYLLAERDENNFNWRNLLPENITRKHLLYSFAGGFLLASGLWLMIGGSIRLFNSSKRARQRARELTARSDPNIP